jgi:hypothetical protein
MASLYSSLGLSSLGFTGPSVEGEKRGWDADTPYDSWWLVEGFSTHILMPGEDEADSWEAVLG